MARTVADLVGTTTRNKLELVGIEVADGLAVLSSVHQRFEASGARARCRAVDPSRGYLVLALRLDNVARTIRYDAGGSLPVTPVGRCLLAAIDEAIAETAIPASVRGALMYQTMEI